MLEGVHNLMIQYGVYSSTVQIEFVDDFPDGVDNHGSCFYASSFGKAKRAFITPPVYKHTIGCPHLYIPGADQDEEDHDHEEGHCHHEHHHERNKAKKGKKYGHDHDDQVDVHLHDPSRL